MHSPCRDVRMHACMHVTTGSSLLRWREARRRTVTTKKSKSEWFRLFYPNLFPSAHSTTRIFLRNNWPLWRWMYPFFNHQPCEEMRRFRKESTTYCGECIVPIRGTKCVLAEQQEISKNSHEATSNPYNRYKGVAPYFTHRVTCLGEIRKSKCLRKGLKLEKTYLKNRGDIR